MQFVLSTIKYLVIMNWILFLWFKLAFGGGFNDRLLSNDLNVI